MKRKIACWLLILGILFSLTACGEESEVKQYQLTDLNPQSFENSYCGLQLSLPGDWQKLSEDEYNMAFASSDGSISLVARLEIGGMSYFSNSDLAGLAAQVCEGSLSDYMLRQELEYDEFEAAGIAMATGTVSDADGNSVNAVCETVVIQYLPAVRCYISVLTDPETYTAYEQAFQDIYKSFQVSKTEDELYANLQAIDDEYDQRHSDDADNTSDTDDQANVVE